MASEVGVAYLTVLPSARGFGSSLQRQVGGDLTRTSRMMGDSAGREYGRRFSSTARNLIGAGLGTALVYGAARVAKESITLEATFSKTMNRVAAATKVPQKEMEALERLAMNLGAQTTFSANEVSEAMLGLAKGGLTQAQIRAGALKDTLTLAAAGDMELKDAADATVSAMGAFNLTGRETGRVASALAGAANASAADVSDLTQALAQAGTEANSVGFSVEETTAALAAFSNAGIQGSDAGTSLRTFLQRLVPTTKEAQEALSNYGLTTYNAARATKVLAQDGIDAASSSYDDVSAAVSKYLEKQGVAEEGTVALEDATRKYLEVTGIMHSDFTTQSGEFKSLAAISGELKKSLEELPPAERSAALSAIFGSDARRAANILVDEGAEGIRKYIKATSDLNAAEKMAGAATKGTAGALERLQGATETAQLKIGRGLAPTVRWASNRLSDFLDTAPLERWANNFGTSARKVWHEIHPLGKDLLELGETTWPLFVEQMKLSRDVLKTMLPIVRGIVKAFNALPDSVQQALVLAVVTRRLTKPGGMLGPTLGAAAAGGAGAAAAGGGVSTGAAAAGGATAGAAFRAAGRRVLLPTAIATTVGFPAIDRFVDKYLDDSNIQDFTGNLKLMQNGVANFTDTLFGWAPGKTGVEEAEEEVGSLDRRIANLATSGHMPAARLMFARLTAAARENGISIATVRKELPLASRALGDVRDAGWRLLGLWRRNLIPSTDELANKFDLSQKEADRLRRELGDTTGTAKQHEKQLRDVAKQLGLTRGEASDLIKRYGDIPQKVETRAEFLTAEAERKRDNFLTQTKGKFSDLGNETYAIMVNGTSGHGRIFASGGFVSGPGGPRDDKIPARLSNGEFVVNAAATSRNRSLLEEINAQKFADGGVVGRVNTRVNLNLRDLRGLVRETIRGLSVAGGGMTSAQVRRGQAFARSQVGDPYVWGGVGPNGYDCSGFMSAVFNAARGVNPYHRLGSTGTMPWPMMREGRGGAFRIGWFTGNPGHTAGTIGGLNVESRGGEGVVVGRNARGADDPLFNRHGYFVTAAGRRLPVTMGGDPASARAVGGSLSPAERWIIGHESGGNVHANNPSSTAFGIGQLTSANRVAYARRLGFNAGREYGDTGTTNYAQQLAMMRAYISDRYTTAARAKAFWLNHGYYDRSSDSTPGILKPGYTLAYNGTGKNEFITDERPRPRPRGPIRIELDIGGRRTLTGYIRDEVDGALDFEATAGRMGR